MSNTLTYKIYRRENDNLKDIPIWLWIIFFGLICFLLWLGIVKEQGLIVLGIIASLPVLYFFVLYPRFWIYSVAGFGVIYFRDYGEGISAVDVITGIFYVATLFIWLFWQIAVKRKKIVRNIADWFIIFFFVFFLFNCIVSIINGVEFIVWLREYSLFAVALYYFPIREYFNEKKYLIRLLLIFCLVVSFVDIMQFYSYYKGAMSDVVYAYELGKSVRTNQSLFTAGAIFGLALALYQKNLFKQIILIIFTTLTIAALVTSFSRTFWMILLIDFFIMFIYLSLKHKARFITYTLIITSVFIAALFMVFKEKTEILFTIIENRFMSSSKGIEDISLLSRLSEYNSVLNKIEELPLSGNGMGKYFTFYNPIMRETARTGYIHNGYLYIAYRLGIPLSIFFVFPMLYYCIKASIFAFKSKDDFYRMIALSALGTSILIIGANLLSTQFAARDGIFVIAIAYACIGIAERNHVKLNNNK